METCVHCDEAALPAIYLEGDIDKSRPFCCEGCLTVYTILHEKGLNSYYDIKSNSAAFKRRSPVELRQSSFTFLDDNEFLKEFSYQDDAGLKVMEFYLEGIHCLACLWLIEKLSEFLPDVHTSKLDLERSVVTVKIHDSGKFSHVARELNQLGYRPHPLKRNQDITSLRTAEERSALLRIGIAGAAAGNIMLYAVSLYGGASGEFAHLFNAFTVAFAVPVLTYCAYPFYQNAWNALKNKNLSIDIPISMSLIMGGVMGIYNLVEGIPDNYFDSLTTLVFLLLMSRYFLQKIQEKGLSASDLHFFYQSDSVLKQESDGSFREIHPKFISTDDILKIKAGDFIPADGILLSGSSHVNNSLLTGESLPVKITNGDKVFSGTQNLDEDILVKVMSTSGESRLGKILRNVEDGWSSRSHIVNLTNKVSKYFTLVVILLSCILFAYKFQSGDFKHALEAAITLLIVTCPCALALAVPLTFTRTLSMASQHGIIIKSDEVIEKLSAIKNIFIDKTGTITFGKIQILNLKQVSETQVALNDVIYNLEAKSKHPVGKALFQYVSRSECHVLPVKDFMETPGIGVSGWINGEFYEIRKNLVFENHIIHAVFEVQDTVRPDSKAALRHLMNDSLNIKVLTGDKKEAAEKIARDVQLESQFVMAELSPEEKSELIKNTPDSLMIGDGANDAIALSHASVGLAVMGAMDISLRAADVYLTTPGLKPVVDLYVLSQETMKVIRRNLVLSLLYNSLSVIAAYMGIINPLIAAIIMPLSSLTVLLSTLSGTKKMRQLWK